MGLFMHMLIWTFKVYLCFKIGFLKMQLLFSDIKEMKGSDFLFYLVTFLEVILGQTTLTENVNKW